MSIGVLVILVFVAVTATQGGDPQPMLRFQPGVPIP